MHLKKVALVEIVARLKDDGGKKDKEEHCWRKGLNLDGVSRIRDEKPFASVDSLRHTLLVSASGKAVISRPRTAPRKTMARLSGR